MPEISETLKGFFTKFFGTVRQQIFDGNLWYPLVCINFSIPQIFWDIEGMPTKFFGTVRQKIFDGKLWYSLLCIKFFDTSNFLKHWRDAHEIFRHCETKNFRLKIVIPPIMHKIFRYLKFSETLKGCPRNFSALWDKKFSTEKRDTPLFIHKTFLKPKIFSKKVGFPYESFRHCET